MKPNVTIEYAKDRIFNMLEKDDQREYIVKDGRKVLKHGHWKYLHDSGALASKGTFIDGLPQGFWQYFHENGRISQRGVYIDGARFSKKEYGDTWEYYDEEGKCGNHIERIEDQKRSESDLAELLDAEGICGSFRNFLQTRAHGGERNCCQIFALES